MLKTHALLVAAGCGLLACLPATAFAADVSPATQTAAQAHVQVPELVQVLSIDGQETSGNFFGARAMTLNLTPGEHVLSLRYNQLFKLGADDHDILKSKPMALRFTAAPGSSYRLTVDPPKRYEAAKEFARQPDIRLIDVSTGISQQAVLVKSYAEASLVDTIGKAFQGGEDAPAPAQSTSGGNVQLLKDIWLRASPEERQAFAAWLASKAASAH